MGKRVHGRLVHEVRDTLYRAGFMPARITQLETPKGPRGIRSPGFKVEKHNDGKSVRLFHVTAKMPAETMNRQARLSPGRAQLETLHAYNTPLEQEGFTRIEVDHRNILTPYTLWRRVDGSDASHAMGLTLRDSASAP